MFEPDALTAAPHGGVGATHGPLGHQLLTSTYAVLLAGGRGARLRELTLWRTKPAMPFGGKLKIIDFTLSNCVNSGLRRIGVLTQYKSQGLIRHVTRAWSFLDGGQGEFVDVVPAQQQLGNAWYSGTANAVYQNLDLLLATHPQYVLVLAADHVYKMDYARMLAEHARRGAQASIACIEVPLEQAGDFGVLTVEADGRVRTFDEKPARPARVPGHADAALASMGVYVFEAACLYRALCRDAEDADSGHDFGHDVLPRLVKDARVYAHDFRDSCVNMVGSRPYWRDVGTLDAYWEANMDLTRPQPELNLYDRDWPIRGSLDPLPPAKFVFDDDGRRGMALDSLVSSGCIVSGAVIRRSLLFTRVRVDDNSLIEDSLVLPDVRVGRGVVLRRVIVDKHCVLPDGIRIGLDGHGDRSRFTVTPAGVTLVTPEMLGQPGPRGSAAARCFRHDPIAPASH